MEWLVLAALAGAAALYIALPRRDDTDDDDASDLDDLHAQRDALVLALRDLDDDVAAGRVAAEDRQRGRQAIGEQLRAVIERLRASGDRS